MHIISANAICPPNPFLILVIDKFHIVTFDFLGVGFIWDCENFAKVLNRLLIRCSNGTVIRGFSLTKLASGGGHQKDEDD
jgi:hypothetical protein